MASSADAILRALNVGLPIPGEDGQELLSAATADAISAAVRAVDHARSRVASGEQTAFWITGKPGNGKTQCLRQLIYRLPRTPGNGKYALATIDFDKQPHARRPEGLATAIVRQSVFTGAVIGGLAEAREAASKGHESDSRRVESVAFGIDVIASVSGLPPVSMVASLGAQAALRWFRMQGVYIDYKVRKKWPNNPQVVSFLGEWARYVLKPTPKAETTFSEYLSQLGANGQLFDMFAYVLQASGYTTLVLALDEVTLDAVQSLKSLRDPELDPTRTFGQSLNLVYVLASREEVTNQVIRDTALSRRFYDAPNGHSRLAGPTIEADEGNDDFAHVLAKVEGLVANAFELRRHHTALETDVVRKRLAGQADVTWQVLWRDVIALCANL